MLKKILVLMIVFLFVGFFVVSSINASRFDDNEFKPFWPPEYISFPSHVEIEMEEYEGRLPIDVSVNIPINISYWVDIPDGLWNLPFKYLKYRMLFGLYYQPMQVVNLTLVDVPEWCNVYLSSPEIMIDIDNTPQVAQTNMIITARVEAIAEPFTITINADVPSLKRICAVECDYDITFTPEFLPSFSINPGTSMVYTPPKEFTLLSIKLKNTGNTLMKINSEVTSNLEGWITYATPEIFIPYGFEVNITFICISPEDFKGSESITIDFTASHWLWNDSTTHTESIYLTLYYPNPP
jgi:hypothetical protein